jgi:hypothetical protein
MLDLLFADRKLGAASKLAFYQLWRFAGNSPGRVVITADWLAGQCGRSPRVAWDWLAELEKHDLIKLGERNERRGTVVVDVYNPAPGQTDRAAITDRTLFQGVDCVATSAGAGVDSSPADVSKPPAGVSVVSAQEAPRLIEPRNTKSVTCQSPNAHTPKEFKETKNSMGGPVGSLSEALATALAASPATDEPAQQKERLKRRIVQACRGKIADWVAGSAANLVVYHDVPFRDVNEVLCDVQAMFDAGSLKNPGAFAHSKFRELAGRLGKPWPRRETVVS